MIIIVVVVVYCYASGVSTVVVNNVVSRNIGRKRCERSPGRSTRKDEESNKLRPHEKNKKKKCAHERARA